MSSMAQTPDTAAAVLVSARAHREAAEAHEAQLLQDAVAWAVIHTTDSAADAAYLWAGSEQTGVPIAGEGAPLIREFAVAEFGAVVGLSPGAGRSLVGQAVELRYRLPRLWGRLVAGQVPAWRARRVAERTLALPSEAAKFVDAQIAPFAHRLGPAVLDRLVEEARARFLPDLVAAEADAAADGRHVTVDRDQVAFHGVMHVEADLDLADALDLDAAVSAGAAQLAACGSTESLDVRRAQALGELCRRQPALGYDRSPSLPAEGPTNPSRTPSRQVVLYVHLAEVALAGGFGVARVENARTSLVTSDQVRSWCRATDTSVVVKPVIDLTDHVRVDQYDIPDRLVERVALRDGTSVFPWCTRPARRCATDAEGHGCDTDHVVPHARGGPTCQCNLAPLCRQHHRLKTHTAWRYAGSGSGSYLWTSPHGYQFRRDHTGTTALADDPPADLGGPVTGHPPDQ